MGVRDKGRVRRGYITKFTGKQGNEEKERNWGLLYIGKNWGLDPEVFLDSGPHVCFWKITGV